MAEPPSIPFRTTGSRLFHPLSVRFNVPLDQVNFAVCQLFALFAAFWFRLYLSPSRAGVVIRHVVITMIGIYFAIFCFGWYSLHIFIEVSLCYCIMITANVSNIHRYSFVAAMSYLTLCQISRVYIFNYGLLATDFSGPLMIVTQKITSLAFQMHDVWFMLITKNFPITYNVDDKFISEASFFRKLCYLFLSVHASRPKYYFAWTLADAVNNAGGFGFNGLDKNGNIRWDLISNLNIWNIETATSFKMCLDSWNIQTGAWLKGVCYDRAPYFPTALTFILSALWHGVYPGYYFTFTTAILITLAARTMRSNFRHYFLSSRMMKTVYDIITWVSTQLALCYIVTPFLLLGAEPTIKFYKSMYFHFHILCAFVLPILAVQKRKSITQTISLKANSSNPALRHQQPKKEQ
ncbi:lysophospholipid acyltransferase 1 isoform X4 [Rhincodon typus]|uniref:lysophospholipid acyltransferase 1 isoform X4 n=1 Tax=Rhincodon typus TaxID=259920 RepID=UPI00202FBFD8|nr:lysophospholipid acyltransferase 1 isoform X4 [Rhincodon typus]